jgi:hypothetical protein
MDKQFLSKQIIMTEEFLHYVWKFRLNNRKLKTTDGKSLELIRSGEHNSDSGPDFLNAMLKLDGTLWAGNVEIHVKSSEWAQHEHDKDEAYDNIILHAVYESDQPVTRKNGEIIPTLRLKDYFSKNAYKAFTDFLNNHLWIPCAATIGTIRPVITKSWIEALCVERLEERLKTVQKLLLYTNNDWNQALYHSLAGSFGARVNKEPFELLARMTPLNFLHKHRDSLFQLESVLFGQAGLLDKDCHEQYPFDLRKEYEHLKNKFKLTSLPGHIWKFLRLRPNNFPTIRLAQLASLLHVHPELPGQILEPFDPVELRKLFRVGVSDYWRSHFHFDKISAVSEKTLGDTAIDLIFINTVIPFIFAYGRIQNNSRFSDLALDLFNQVAAENNSIIRNFKNFGVDATNAGDSQGLIQLKSRYCDSRKCLECRIGLELLK